MVKHQLVQDSVVNVSQSSKFFHQKYLLLLVKILNRYQSIGKYANTVLDGESICRIHKYHFKYVCEYLHASVINYNFIPLLYLYSVIIGITAT